MSERTFAPVRDLRAGVFLARLLRELRPDTVHSVQSKAGLLGRAFGPRAATHVYSVTLLNFGPAYPKPVSAVALRAERLLSRLTDVMLVAGTDLRDEYLEARIGELTDYLVCRASVSIDHALGLRSQAPSEVRPTLGLPQAVPIVSFVGRMEHRKGVRDVPRMFERVLTDFPDAVMVLAGTGSQEAALLGELRAVCSTAGQVVGLGHVADVPALLRATDCVVLPSSTEGLPQVLVQAAAVGTPFVSYRVSGAAELIGLGATGRIVDRGDHAAMADQVVDTLRTRSSAGDFIADSWSEDAIASTWRRALGPKTRLAVLD